MGGYTRMTYSLSVIMMETTQDLSLFIPIMLAMLIGNQTGYLFTRSLYERATRGKQLPIITDKIPLTCRELRAGDIMADNPVYLNAIDTVKNIQKVLNGNNHHAFPLLDAKGELLGIVPRNFIIILITQEAWYNPGSIGSSGAKDNEINKSEGSSHSRSSNRKVSKS